jgi:hypothetical protein
MNESTVEDLSAERATAGVACLGAAVTEGVDDFVRNKPAVAVLGALAIGFIVAQSLQRRTAREEIPAMESKLKDLGNLLNHFSRQIHHSGEEAGGHLSCMLQTLRKKAARLF